MDRALALRLDSCSSWYDAELYRKLSTLITGYIQDGLATLGYYQADFDSAYDLSNALATLGAGMNQQKFDKLDRSAASNFSDPCGATEIDVLATAISQILYGGELNRTVAPRNPDDETKANALNQLLAWNDQQQDTYIDGFLFVKDSLICRGIQYDCWSDQFESALEEVKYTIPETPNKDKRRKPTPAQESTRWRIVKKKTGGYCRVVNISPYDFISDPTIPLSRFQESRYAGHRVILSWQELERRSKLPIDDYNYVLPEVVKRLKNQKERKGITSIGVTGGNVGSTSRTFYERQRRGIPQADMGMNSKINDKDGGVVECWCMTLRITPKEHDIYEDEDAQLIQFLIAGESDLLSVNVMTDKHGDYPYAVAEARPNAHAQFAPSLAMLLKPTQNQIDVRRSAHEEQVERCGIIVLADGTKCNIEQVLTDKSRIRQFVLRTEEGQGVPSDQILEAIEMPDSTKTFPQEMEMLKKSMEDTSGAHPHIQGTTEDPGQTATQYEGDNQMAMGRISTMARNISSRSLIRQTRRISMNLQQHMPDRQTVRIVGQPKDYDPEQPPPKYLTVRREPISQEEKAIMDAEYAAVAQQAISQGLQPPPLDPKLSEPDIQFAYDVVPHDGSLPGVDAKAVAAASRLIEAAANPSFQQAFDPCIPGNLDPRALLLYVAEKSGMPVANFRVTRETALKNARAKMAAQGMMQQPQITPGPSAPIGPNGIPSAQVLPQTPSAAAPPPNPIG